MNKTAARHMKLLILSFLALAFLGTPLAGCGGSSGSTAAYSTLSTSSITTSSTPQNITDIMPFSDVANLPAGTVLKVRLNRTGTEVTLFNATFNGVDTQNNERLILCHIEDSTRCRQR